MDCFQLETDTDGSESGKVEDQDTMVARRKQLGYNMKGRISQSNPASPEPCFGDTVDVDVSTQQLGSGAPTSSEGLDWVAGLKLQHQQGE